MEKTNTCFAQDDIHIWFCVQGLKKSHLKEYSMELEFPHRLTQTIHGCILRQHRAHDRAPRQLPDGKVDRWLQTAMRQCMVGIAVVSMFHISHPFLTDGCRIRWRLAASLQSSQATIGKQSAKERTCLPT